MRFKRSFVVLFLVVIAAYSSSAQDKSLGSIKGKVKVETGTPAGITVVVRRGETEVTQVVTDKNGEFLATRLTPGIYGVTMRKPGLSIGTMEDIEVKAGKTRSLGDRMFLTIDEGSIAFVGGSVFDAAGRSIPNVKVELFRILENGSAKKIDGRITTETGSFKFRLAPEHAMYRVSVKPDGGSPVTKEVEVDGAAIYRVALSFPPPKP
jgi:hypothetical protein